MLFSAALSIDQTSLALRSLARKFIRLQAYKIKKLFLFFYPHTLTIRLKRPVYRGFNGEGWCEGVRVKRLKLLSPGRKSRCLFRTLIERITQIFCISPIQRPHYFTSSYTYQFFEKSYICSSLQYRPALVVARMRKDVFI